MKKILYFFLPLFLLVLTNYSKAQTAHKIAVEFYAKATSGNAVSIYADTLTEGQVYTIKQETLPSSYSDAQSLYNALVGSEFYFQLGSLNQNITLYFVISDIDLSSGIYTDSSGINYFYDVSFSAQDSSGKNIPEPFYLNSGKYAVIKIYKSNAFNNFIANTNINLSLALAFAYETSTGYDLSGIQTFDSTSSITAYVSHFSKVIGTNKSDVTDVKTVENNIPSRFALKQNYPNPFNPSTNIEYDLPQKSYVELNVYNILGEKIATLVNGVKEAGSHIVNFNPGNISSGLYIYQLRTNKVTISRKMIFMK